MQVPVDMTMPMLPKQTAVTCTFVVVVSPNLLSDVGDDEGTIDIYVSKVTFGIPMAERFVVHEKIRFRPIPDGTGTSINCKSSARLVFLANCGIFAKRIQAAAMLACRKRTEKLVDCLRVHDSCEKEETAKPDSFILDTICHTVWELQRRRFPYMDSWQHPFLLHDGERRWKWVDSNMTDKHPLLEFTDRKAAVLHESPPLSAPDGWQGVGVWQLSISPRTDPDGWQYAFDFGRHEGGWVPHNTGGFVRRRQWSRQYIRDSEATAEAFQSFIDNHR